MAGTCLEQVGLGLVFINWLNTMKGSSILRDSGLIRCLANIAAPPVVLWMSSDTAQSHQ